MKNIEVKMSSNAEELLRRTNSRGALDAAAKAMDLENQFTVSHIQAKYLSFPKTGSAQSIGCRVQTNRLRASIRATKPVVSATEGSIGSIQSGIGSNVKHAAPLEFGTAPYVIKPKPSNKSGVLRFKIGDRFISKQQVNHPGLQPREFVQRGIRDRLDDYRGSMGGAVVKFLTGGAT